MDYFVHETSIVEPGAQVGSGTKIWHFSHVMPKAIIGAECVLGQNVFVADNAIIGNHVKIQNNVSIYEGVILEDFVFCGPSTVFTNTKTPRSAYPRNTLEEHLVTRVKYGATLGANSTILCGLTVGEWAMVGAGAVVSKDVPAYALVAGGAGAIIGWSCECGVTLVIQDERGLCRECGKTYQSVEGRGFEPEIFRP
jgi:UDP-2-acetamido-3-amino-2,3-dideoxy-glucuronate N-acetyltransferase